MDAFNKKLNIIDVSDDCLIEIFKVFKIQRYF